MLCLKADDYDTVISNNPTYRAGAADNAKTYRYQYWLGEQEYQPSTQHGVRVIRQGAEVASCILLGTDGATGVHEHSALFRDRSCILAVSAFVCALAIPSLQLQWQVKVDWATCFGVYHAAKHCCYISHGECEIACISYTGQLLWSMSGKDIFTNGFYLYEDSIEVIDWNEELYCIDIASGNSHLNNNPYPQSLH